MMSPETSEPLEFSLYDKWDNRNYQAVERAVAKKQLPYDTIFRLGSIGILQGDPQLPGTNYLQNVLTEIAQHTKQPHKMRPEVQTLLFESDRPDAIVDLNNQVNSEAYARLDPMYYRMADMATAIQTKRTDSRTATANNLHYDEWSRCMGLARPIWRVLTRRFHPEWLAKPKSYTYPTMSFGNIYTASEKTMQRRVVSNAVFSDTLVMGLYRESVENGVVGIGPGSRESLRYLLADEHPELIV